jgi:hypothetical protein
MNTKKFFAIGLLLALPSVVSGCFLTLGDLDKIFPVKIGPASISNIRVEPATLPGGVTQSVTVSFAYNHEDGDLGLKAKVIVKLSGATLIEQPLELNKTNDTVRVPGYDLHAQYRDEPLARSDRSDWRSAERVATGDHSRRGQ